MKRKYIFILFLIAVLPYVGAEVTLVDTKNIFRDGNYLFVLPKQFPVNTSRCIIRCHIKENSD